MSSNENIPEISLTATEFRGRLKSAYQNGGTAAPRKVEFLGSFGDGSRYLVEDGVRAIVFYLVTDLKSFLRGVANVTIGNFQLTGTGGVTIPALPDPNLSNWIVLTTIQDTTGLGLIGFMSWGALTSTTNLTLWIGRIPNKAEAYKVIVNQGSTEISQDSTTSGQLTDHVTVSAPDHVHGLSTVVTDGHQHTASTGLSESSPGHTHTLPNISTGRTVAVGWMIIHI